MKIKKDEETIKKIKELRAKKWTWQAIANYLDVSKGRSWQLGNDYQPKNKKR